MAHSNDYRPDRRQAKSVLKKAFEKHPHPNKEQIEAISIECGRSVETVVKWFKQERQKHGMEEREERRSTPTVSQPVIHDSRDSSTNGKPQQITNSEWWGIGQVVASTNFPGLTALPWCVAHRTANEQWGQFPPSNADDVPSLAFGELHKQQHELHCAMAMYHLATLGLPMNLTPEPEAK
ncbi:hypothetical protein FRC11_006896 [Ceratobasidium sp. 423]|nr:hypothetical protein FRC11_006896 [Ceratobasidium sp. 423]